MQVPGIGQQNFFFCFYLDLKYFFTPIIFISIAGEPFPAYWVKNAMKRSKVSAIYHTVQ